MKDYKKSVSLLVCVMFCISLLIFPSVVSNATGEQSVKDGLYTIKNVSSGYMLNVYAGKDANGTKVTTWEYDGTTDQRIYITHQGNGKYLLKFNASSNGRVVDINRGESLTASIDDGDKIDIWTANDLDAQYFYINPCGDGSYIFELVSKPGYVISAVSSSAAKSNGTQLQLKRYTGEDYQKWYICNTKGSKIDVCNHVNTSEKNNDSIYAQLDDFQHSVTLKYDVVCDDCNNTINSNLSATKKDNHKFSNNKCISCGYELSVKECSHTNTYNKVKSYVVAQKDDTYHLVTDTFNVVCFECNKVVKENMVKSYDEKHGIVNDSCDKCNYVVPGSEASKCKHDNTVKHASEDMKTVISIKNDTYHTVASYYNTYCTSCNTYVEKNLPDVYDEEHEFVNNICSKCNLEKLIEKPGTVTLKVSKTSFTPGEEISLTWTKADRATGYDIHVEKKGVDTTYRIDSGFTGTSGKIKLSEEGTYTLAIYPTNKAGYIRGGSVVITVKKTYAEKTAYVYNTDGANLNMRSQANTASTIVTKMPEGSAVTVTGEATKGFYPVKYGKYTGYASTQYLTFTKPSITLSNQSLTNVRTSAPEKNNKYYYSNSNVFYACGYGPYGSNIPSAKGNCTWYAWGRAYELTGKKPMAGLTGNAYTWWNGAAGKYSRGSTPKVGAIAVWKPTMPYSGGCGHVAVVEKIENGKVYVSESGYPNTLFRYREIYSTNYLYGYIYVK